MAKPEQTMKKNDCIELTVTGVSSEGSGIGRHNGMAVFVPLSAVGDVLDVRILKVKKSYAYGKIEAIKSPSPDRIDPDCPFFSQCGGCCYRHISYRAELDIKYNKVADAVKRIAGCGDIPIRPILQAESRNGYRNKALLPLGTDQTGKLTMGFYALHSHRIVNCGSCLLQPDEFNTAMDVFRRWSKLCGDTIYDEGTHSGNLRRLYLRKAEKSGEIMACVVVNRSTPKHMAELREMLLEQIPSLKSLIINVNSEQTNVALGKKCETLYGPDSITDELCGLRFDISPLSFYQVNRRQAEILYQKAAEYAGLRGDEILLDLYCGTGTIGLSMAAKTQKLIGVEIIGQAVEDARKNARQNGIANAEFICADASEAVKRLREQGVNPDVILVDPPRKGCDPDLIRTIADFSPDRIVYISCDPATLARDIKIFLDHGFCTREITPVDMFPATAHMECVALISKAS